MRCETAQLELSTRMDEAPIGAAVALAREAEAHAATCPDCGRFDATAWRIRSLSRFELAPPVPELVPAIMLGVRAEAEAPSPAQVPVADQLTARRKSSLETGPAGAATRGHGRPWRAAVAALVAGLVIGGVLTSGGLIPRREAATPARADEIPAELTRAATGLVAYQATFDITELHWTRAVPRRSFVAELAFRAPEELRVVVRDTTSYPSTEWPRNDLLLVSNGRAWRAEGPDPCPAPALPACPNTQPVARVVTHRAPFDASTQLPTELIVPMTVLAASDRVSLVGSGEVTGRPALVVQLAYQDARSLFDSFQFLGSWRPFFPQDRVLVWLDRDTWFPLRYEVFPALGPERAQWAAQSNLPPETPDAPVFEATAASLSTSLPAGAFAAEPPPGAAVADQGFGDASLAALRSAGTAPPEPATTEGMPLVRSGAFARSSSRPYTEAVAAYARGLSWLTVTRVTGWKRPALFGVGRFAESLSLADPAGTGGSATLAGPSGIGYYEPADPMGPRRLALHTVDGEVLVETNLGRTALLRVAGSLRVRGLPEPSSWAIRRWSGGVVRAQVTPEAAIAEAGFPVLLPGELPAGYLPVAAELWTAGRTRGLTIAYRRPAAELDGVGLLLSQAEGQAMPPPNEPGGLAISVGDAVARWSPEQHRLEWVDGGVYRSLSGPSFDLTTMVRIAEALRPAPSPSPSGADASPIPGVGG